MRILHVTSGIDPRCGGPAIAIAGLATAQAGAGLEVTVASTYVNAPSPEVRDRLAQANVACAELGPCHDPMSRHPDLQAWLEPLIHQADVVHIHALWESVQHAAASLARTSGKPYVVTPHGMLDRWNMSNGWLKKRLYLAWRLARDLREASAMHFVTPLEQEWAIPIALPGRAIVEPFGLEFAEFEALPAAGTFRACYPELGIEPFALFLGRIDRGKGWEYLIPAFAEATAGVDLRHWHLVIAGPDYFGNQARAEQLAREAGLMGRVIFTGMLSAPQRLAALRDCEFLALPSCHENFGIVVAEAMAAGRPVIISDQVALHDQVRRWQAGEVTPLQVPRIADALKRWMLDPDGRAESGGRGREMAGRHFRWDTIAGHWREHYAAVAGR